MKISKSLKIAIELMMISNALKLNDTCQMFQLNINNWPIIGHVSSFTNVDCRFWNENDRIRRYKEYANRRTLYYNEETYLIITVQLLLA